MSKEYDQYLASHKESVKTAYQWFKRNMPEFVQQSIVGGMTLEELEHQILVAHDSSEMMFDEYPAYDRYFYSDLPKNKTQEEFNLAWLRHIHRNPHHWEHWVLPSEDLHIIQALEMPQNYVLEMLCDWWSFSWRNYEPDRIFEWWDRHKDIMILHPKTRDLIHDVMWTMTQKLKTAKDEFNSVFKGDFSDQLALYRRMIDESKKG